MTDIKIEALLTLKGAGFPGVGRDRIAMLEAIRDHGSITQAARVLGYSYKAVWDAVAAINNLLPHPAVNAKAGGATGGRAEVTEEGTRLIRDFHLLENRLSRISEALTAEGETGFGQLWWSVGMRTSARNVFRCRVATVVSGPVNVEVALTLAEGTEIVAVITRASADELGIEPGREVIALVKSSFVMLCADEDPPRLSARNRLKGVISGRTDGAVNSDITLDIGGGKTLTAVITKVSAGDLNLAIGDAAWAVFDAGHVILVMD